MGQIPNSKLSILEVMVPPGSGTPPHTHTSEEVFHVLSGEITFGRFDATPHELTTATIGATITVPPNVPHNYQNTGPTAANILVIVDHTMVEFFRDIGRSDEPPAGPVTTEEITTMLAACARHSIRVLPPAIA